MLARVMRVTFFPLLQRALYQATREREQEDEECGHIYLTMTSYLGVSVCIRPSKERRNPRRSDDDDESKKKSLNSCSKQTVHLSSV